MIQVIEEDVYQIKLWPYDYYNVKFSIIIVVCGGVFSTSNGSISSPMYPKYYEMSRTCDYLIEAPIGKAIMLDFTDMDMEDNSYPSCEFDYLSVFHIFY